jgi:hypothetical protein
LILLAPSSCPSSNDTCVRDGCREGSEDSTRVDCYTNYSNPSYSLPTPQTIQPLGWNRNTGEELQWRTLVPLTQGKEGGEVAPRAGLSRRERNVSLFFFSFGSITGRDNKALSLSLWFYLPFVQEDLSTTTSSSLIPTARAHTHTVVGGRRKSFFFQGSVLRLFRPPVNQSGDLLLNWKPPPHQRERLLTTTTHTTCYSPCNVVSSTKKKPSSPFFRSVDLALSFFFLF